MQGLKEFTIERSLAHRRRGVVLTILSVILLIMVVLAAVRFSTVGVGTNDQLTVHIADQQAATIDLRQSTPISPYLLGTSVFPKEGSSSLDQSFDGFMPSTPLITSDLQAMRIKLLRYPGGDWGENHILSIDQLKDFSTLLNQTSAEGMLQAHLSGPVANKNVPGDIQPHNMTNDLNSRANLAGRWVDYMNNKKSDQRVGTHKNDPFHPVKFWTVGNEPNRSQDPMTNQTYTVADYVNAFIQYSKVMHQADPNIKVFGPEISQFYGIGAGPFDAKGHAWMEDFLKGVSDYEKAHPDQPPVLDGVSFHRYQFNTEAVPPSLVLSVSNEWEYLLSPLKDLIKRDFGRDIPIGITEVNTNPGNPLPTPGVASLWWADTLGQMMNFQVGYVAFFSAAGVEQPYPLFTQNGLKETAMARVMQLFARLQSNVIPLKLDRNPVSVYATVDDNRQNVGLLLVNKSQQAQVVQVDPVDQFMGLTPWHGQTIALAPYSMSVVTLHRTGGAEASTFIVPNGNNANADPLRYTQCGNKSDPLDNTKPC